jgi:hypothetical protein
MDTANVSSITESYNGSAWAEVNDLNTARDLISAGTGHKLQL